MNTRKGNSQYLSLLLALAVLLLVLTIFSFVMGRYSISVGGIFAALYSKIRHKGTINPSVEGILFHVRLPRIMFAILVGAALSVAGASYQAVFKNPLVSADVIGASSGAAFGASLAILFGLSSRQVSISAFLGSIIAVGIVYFVGNMLKINKVLGLVLSGIMVGSIFKSGLSFVQLVADPVKELPQIVYWLMGSLTGSKSKDILPVFIVMFMAMVPLWLVRWNLNLLTIGEEEALSMGINVDLLRCIVILSATLLTSSAIAVSGMIGWISLAIPHFARLVVGSDYRKLIPISLLMGSNFLLIVDNISRLTFTAEIPLGIITSLVGAPFFLYLLYRERGKTVC